MIRFVAIASLLALLILVLYLPSAYPAERFMNQLRAEHALNTDFWGHESIASDYLHEHRLSDLTLVFTAEEAHMFARMVRMQLIAASGAT
jgi:hypothetical protein